MEQLFRLQARASSLTELQNLIRALRALAATHFQEAEDARSGISRYVEVIEQAIAEGVSLLPEGDETAIPARTSDPGVLIAICSEQSFVGGLNGRLLDYAVSKRSETQRLFIIGRRGAMLAKERKVDVAQSFSMATHVGGVLGTARHIADHLTRVTSADVVFASSRRGAEPELSFKTILPLDPSLLLASVRSAPPLHQLEPEILLRELAAEYLLAELTHALMEALASENAVRLRVMEAADHNISDKLENLERQENSVRQEMITSELLELVTGAEAVQQSADRRGVDEERGSEHAF